MICTPGVVETDATGVSRALSNLFLDETVNNVLEFMFVLINKKLRDPEKQNMYFLLLSRYPIFTTSSKPWQWSLPGHEMRFIRKRIKHIAAKNRLRKSQIWRPDALLQLIFVIVWTWRPPICIWSCRNVGLKVRGVENSFFRIIKQAFDKIWFDA